MTTAVPIWVTISPNSRTAPHFRLALEVAPGTKRMSLQLAPTPSTKSRRAGMLVTNVPMNSHPKIRPVLVTSTAGPPDSVVKRTQRVQAMQRFIEVLTSGPIYLSSTARLFSA